MTNTEMASSNLCDYNIQSSLSIKQEEDDEEIIISVVKHNVLKTLVAADLSNKHLKALEQWIANKIYRKDLNKMEKINSTKKVLSKIGKKIEEIINIDCSYPKELLINHCTNTQVLDGYIGVQHVDEFIYDEETVDSMVEKGQFIKWFCNSCGSFDVKEVDVYSHSLSISIQQYIYNYFLPKDLSKSQLLDVGSGIGAVLYGAYYMTNFSKICGVEFNKNLCNLQNDVIEHFNLDKNRIQVVHSDITDESTLIKSSNYIIMNNVFEHFADKETEIKIWRFFKMNVKKDSCLIVIPDVETTFQRLGICEEFHDWLECKHPSQLKNEHLFESIDECNNVYYYAIK